MNIILYILILLFKILNKMSDLKELWDSIKETFFTDDETKEKLMEIKKSIAKEYIEEIKKWNKKVEKSEKMLENYLINNESFKDKLKNTFRWFVLSIKFKKDIDTIKKVKEKISSIKETTTEEELSSLKSEIMNLKPEIDADQQSQTTQQNSWETTWTSSVDNSTDLEDTEWSAQVGEAKEVELKQRMQWLFPEWVPQTEKEMKKYLTKIKVPIITESWKSKKLTLHVHKKLSKEYIAIFEDMKNSWIKVNPDTTACFNWRKMRRWKKMSHHSYGTAIDVNRDVNWWVYWKTDKNSPYFNDQACVNIWKKHGFYRWWDWSSKSNDPMHFTYMNA